MNRRIREEEMLAKVPDSGWCEECQEECYPVVWDFGIGETEAWGVRSKDERLEVASSCCHAGFLEEEPGLEENNR